jgi:hypothetical protein
MTLHNGGRHIIDEVELRRKFGQVGDVKSIKNIEFRPEYAFKSLLFLVLSIV